MKLQSALSLLLISIFLAGCKGSTSYQPKVLDPNVTYSNVYLLMGQSNASGVAECSYLENTHPEVYQRYTEGNSKVLISYNTGFQVNYDFVPTKFGQGHQEEYFGPEIGMAETLNTLDETSYIIKSCEGATCLMTQYVNERGKKLKLYKKYVGFIQEQLKVLEKEGKTPRVRGIFWVQGESDSFLEKSYKYKDAEEWFFKYLRHDLNNYIYDHFNFVDAYIYTDGMCWVNPEIINDCKQRFADENEHCYCIKVNGEDESAIKLYLKCESDQGDDLAHYDAQSNLLLGMTAANYLIK